MPWRPRPTPNNSHDMPTGMEIVTNGGNGIGHGANGGNGNGNCSEGEWEVTILFVFGFRFLSCNFLLVVPIQQLLRLSTAPPPRSQSKNEERRRGWTPFSISSIWSIPHRLQGRTDVCSESHEVSLIISIANSKVQLKVRFSFLWYLLNSNLGFPFLQFSPSWSWDLLFTMEMLVPATAITGLCYVCNVMVATIDRSTLHPLHAVLRYCILHLSSTAASVHVLIRNRELSKVQLELNGWGLYMEPRPSPVLARVLSTGAVKLRDKRMGNSANMMDIPIEIGDFNKGFGGKCRNKRLSLIYGWLI